MQSRVHLRRGPVRLLLVLAALLHLGGVAAEPLVHAYLAAQPEGAAPALLLAAGEEMDDDAPLPHDESGCALCLVVAGQALAAGAASAAAPAEHAPRALAAWGPVRAPPAFLLPSPRAPPAA